MAGNNSRVRINQMRSPFGNPKGLLVPGAGIEPARIAPLVFETSASTDSAIRAFCHKIR